MKIKTCCIIYFCALVAFADQLVVTKRGESFRVKSSEVKGSNLAYTAMDGSKRGYPKVNIDAIIPAVTLGEDYSEAQITDILSKISAVGRKHVKLTRKLNVLKNEWLALQRNNSSSIAPEIRTIVRTFMSNQSADTYSTAIMDLGMLKYKHKGEADNLSAIESSMGDLQSLFYGISLDQFSERANDKSIDLGKFINLNTIAKKAEKHGTDDDIEAFNNLLAAARTSLITKYKPYARSAFKAKQSVDSYIKGISVLTALKEHVAYTEEEKASINEEYDFFKAAAQKALPRIDFSFNDFPITSSDEALYAKTEPYTSQFERTGLMPDKEKVFLLPKKKPILHDGTKGTLEMPFTAIFNHKSMHNVEYAVVVACVRYRRAFKHYTPLPAFRDVGGHVSIPFRCNLAKAGYDIAPMSDKDGSYILLFLAERIRKEIKSDDDWKLISKGCRIPVME